MNKYFKQVTPLIYAFIVVLVFMMLGIFWYTIKDRYNLFDSSTPTQEQNEPSIPDEAKKIDKSDPVRGNKDAKYALIEYSDYDCPFCKDFHDTMAELIKENSEFKWIFRQFPIAQLHPNATDKAKSAMCVYKVAGNESFWKYSDVLYQDQSVEPAALPNIVKQLGGINEKEYTDCIANFDAKDFNKHFDIARQMNITGTPTTLIVNTDTNNATLIVGSLSKDEILAKAKELD